MAVIHGGVTDRSVNLSTTAATVVQQNKGRQWLLLVNAGVTGGPDIWINLAGIAAANTAGSVRLAADGGYFEMGVGGGFVSTSAISAVAESGTPGLTIYEG